MLKLILRQGDLTKEDCDAIVNAANSSLLGGGGVDGAIHRAGGSAILEACRAIRDRQGKCATGDAVITTGGNLPARFVIHTVGPVWNGGAKNEPALLRSCYQKSLQLAANQGLKSIAFPSISTGVFGFPIELAAPIAVAAVQAFPECSLEEVRFIVFSDYDLEVYQALKFSEHSSTTSLPTHNQPEL